MFGSYKTHSSVSIANTGYNSSSNSLSVTTNLTPILITLPPFDVAADSIELDFFLQTPANVMVKIGLMNDIADYSTMDLIYNQTINTTAGYRNIRVNTQSTNYPSSTRNLFLFIELSAPVNTTINIDNIRIYKPGSCLRLEELKAKPDSLSVQLDWIDYSIAPSNNYQVKYINESTQEIGYFTGSTRPLTVTGLEGNTPYTFFIRSVCSASDSSEWSMPVSTTTLCRPISAIFFEDFENQTIFDDCWLSKQTVLGDPTATNKDLGDNGWNIYTYQNNKVARLSYAKSGGRYILATPALSIDYPKQYDMKVKFYRNGKESEFIKVWASNTTDTADGVLISTISRSINGDPIEIFGGWHEYEFNIPIAGAVHIIFDANHYGGGYSDSYIDDIQIYPAPKCREPKNLEISSTTNTIDLSWTPGEADHTAWNVNYTITDANGNTTSNNIVVNDPLYSITGLNEAQYYTLTGYISTHCSDTLESIHINFNEIITTKCNTISTFPYVEDFEGTTTFPPVCWERKLVQMPTSGTNLLDETWSISLDPEKSHTGTGAAWFQKCGYPSRAFLVSPKFMFDENKSYQVRLWMYRSNLATNSMQFLKLRVSQTPFDESNESAIAIELNNNCNINPTEQGPGYYEYTAEIPHVCTGEQYLIFEVNNTNYVESFIYLDDIVVEEVPACKPISKITAFVEDYSSIMVHLSEYVAENPIWDVVAITDNQTIEDVTPIHVVGADSVLITGLTASTNYRVFVRKYCAVDTMATWSANPYRITTPCEQVYVTAENPFLENFDSFESGALFDGTCYTAEKSYAYQNPINITSAVNNIYPPYSGNRCAQFYGTSYLMREFQLEAGKTYEVSVYALANNTTGSTTSGDRISFYLASEPKHSALLSTLMSYQPVPDKWTRFSTVVSVASTGNYYIGIDAYASRYLGIDNWSVREIECVTPTNIVLSNITTTTATINFIPTGATTEIRVATVNNGDLDPAYDVVLDTVSTNSLQITGLQPDSKYYYTLRSFCSDDKTSGWSTINSFHTLCSAKNLPYENNFEIDNSDILCWTVNGNNAVAELSNAQYHRVGISSLKLQNTTMVSPELNVSAIANCRVNGYIYGTTGSSLLVGVMSDPTDVSTFEPLATVAVNAANEWMEFDVDFSDLNGDDYVDDPLLDAKFVAFLCGENIVYIDDITIYNSTSCSQVNQVIFSNLDSKNLNVSWVHNDAALSYEVKALRLVENQNGGNSFVVDFIDTVSVKNITIQNLYPNTSYIFTVKTLCSGSDCSLPFYSDIITTNCAPVSLFYPGDLVTESANNKMPSCWTQGDYFPVENQNVWRPSNGILWSYNSSEADVRSELLSPIFDFNDLVGAQIIVEATINSTDTVYIMASYDGGLTFTDTIGFLEPSVGVASRSNTLDASKCAGHNVMFAIRARKLASETNFSMRLSKFAIEPINSCAIPISAIVSNISGITASVVINDTCQAHSTWNYVLVPQGNLVETGEIKSINKTIFNLDNLTPKFKYDFYVRSDCGGGEVSSWRGPISFETTCDVARTPYFENFETTDGCYQTILLANNGSNPRVMFYYTPGNSAEKSLCFVSASFLTNTGNTYLVFPRMTDPLTELVVDFDYIQRAGSGQFSLGIMDGNNTNSFIELRSLEYTENYGFVHVNYPFNALNTTYNNYRIVIKFSCGDKDNVYSFIDNVNIHRRVVCENVTDVNIVSTSSTQVKFNVESTTDSVEVCIVPAGDLPSEAYTQISDSKEFIVNGLTSATAYSIYTRSVCSNYSFEWYGPVNFSTSCDLIIIDALNSWSADFDDVSEVSCIDYLRTSKVDGVSYPAILNSTVGSMPNALVIKGDNYILLPEFSVMPQYLELSFNNIGNCDLFIGTIQDNDINTYKELDYYTTQASRQRAVINFSTYKCSGNRIVLSTKGASSIIYLDDMMVSLLNTDYAPVFVDVKPQDVFVDVVVNTVVNSDRVKYEVFYGNQLVASQVSTESSIRLVGLTPSTSYFLRATSFTFNDNDSLTSVLPFTTKKSILSAPFTIDFEDNNDNAVWDLNYTASDRFVFGTANSAVKSGSKSLYVSRNPFGSKAYEYTKEAGKTYVSREIYLPAGTYELSYDYKVKGYNGSDYGRIFLIPDGKDFPSDNMMSIESYDYIISLDNKARMATTDTLWHKNTTRVTVDEGSNFKFVIYWMAGGYYDYQPPLAVDNISCLSVPCSVLDNFVVNVNSNDAYVNYSGYNEGTTINYILFLDNDTVSTGSVQSSSIHLTGLTPNSEYSVEIIASCDEGSTTPIYLAVNTKCEVINAPWNYGFEDLPVDVKFAVGNNCWTEVVKNTSYYFYSTNNDLMVNYGLENHSGNQSVTYRSGTQNSGVIFNTFHLEANTNYNLSAYVRHLDQSNTGNTFSIVMLENGKISKELASYEMNGVWQKYDADIVVKTTGDYQLGFYLKHNNTNAGKYILTTIDDVSFVQAVAKSPVPIEFSNITNSEADVTWSDIADSYVVTIRNNDGVVLESEPETNYIHLTGLSANTTYQVSVYGVSEIENSRTATASFTTECGIAALPYRESFNNTSSYLPSCWSDQGTILSNGAYGWAISSGKLMINTSVANGYAIVTSMPISIAEPDVNLSFNYTNASSSDRFIVSVISGNGAVLDTVYEGVYSETLQKVRIDLAKYYNSDIQLAFSIITCNIDGGIIAIDDLRITKVLELPVINDTICRDETYYKYGFQVDANSLNIGHNTLSRLSLSTGSSMVDSVIYVDLYVAPKYVVSIDDTICKGQVYNKGLFANVNPPITTTGRYEIPFTSSFGCDSTVVLHLLVLNLDSTINVTICEGDSYEFNGVTYTEEGIYTINGINDRGCDVTTTINLVVMPQYYESNIIRCDSESYQWEDTVITTTGTYFRYYQNSLGCDSIIKLNYTSVPTAIYDTVTICSGGSYVFGGELITEEGTYQHSYTSTLGCDSTVYLILYKAPVIRSIVSDYVCENEIYNGNGFSLPIEITGDTILERTFQTPDGCDSIVELHLTFIPTVYDTVRATINEGEYYEFGGNTYTQAGEYKWNFYTDLGCDSVVTLYLTVVTGVEGTYTLPITVAPNPIRGGETTYIVKEWSAEEQQGLVVEVFNSLGQKLSSFRPTIYPIAITDLHVSGVYYVRITDGSGNIYTGRVLVK